MSYTNIFTKKKKEDSNQTLGNLPTYKRVLETGKQGGIGNYLVNSFNKQNTNSSVTPYATPKVTPNQYDKPIGPANQTQTNQAPDPVQSYFDKFKANATDRAYEQADYTNRANQQYTGQINEVYDNEATALKETMPSEENLNKNVERIRGSLGVARNRADVYKDNVETDTGRDIRQLAESKRTNDAQRKNIFAANNTVDSYGVGGLDMEQSNADNVLLREQSESLRGKRQQLAEIDNQLLDLESKVEQTVNDEISNFEKTVQQINAQLRGNEMGRKQALQSAFSSLEEKLLGIRDQYRADSSELDNAKLEFELSQSSNDGLSEEFMTTGVPQNEADFAMKFKNPGEYSAMFGGNKGSDDQNKALTMVNNLLGGNTNTISGAWRPGTSRIPLVGKAFGGGQEATEWEGLQNLLTLAQRGKLKGSGAVSDFETRMLEKAAMAGLDPTRQSEEQFRKGLEQLQRDLKSQGAVDQFSNVSTDDNPLGLDL